jgi:hypothetical protein
MKFLNANNFQFYIHAASQDDKRNAAYLLIKTFKVKYTEDSYLSS